MKVLFVCPFVPWPPVGGGKIRTFNLVREASRHAEVHLRVLREPGVESGIDETLANACASIELFDRTPPSRLKRLARPKIERWFHSQKLMAGLASDLAGGDFQLVHLDELLLARVMPQAHGVPVVQHHHKLDTVLYETLSVGQGPARHFDLWKLRRLERESARRYRNHLLCSREDADILTGRYGALDVGVVPSGFDPEVFRPSEPPPAREPDHVLFLGSMDYGPNVDAMEWFAAEVFPRILEARPGTILDIVGGSPPPSVQALASDSIRVIGRAETVQPWLESCATMVVPLRIGGGTRLKIVEALGMGTPVVSTTIGAEGLGLRDEVELSLADDPESFANATLRHLAEPEFARRLGRTGMRTAHERFRWEVLGEELVDYWERVAFSGKLSPSR